MGEEFVSRLVRVLSLTEAIDGSCNGPDGCDADPSFRVSTPLGDIDYCDLHVEAVVESFAPEWVDRFEPDEPAPTATLDSPAKQAVAVQHVADALAVELARRAAGKRPDRTWDPLLATLLDFADKTTALYEGTPL